MVLGYNRDKMLYHGTPNDHASRTANFNPGSVGPTKSKNQTVPQHLSIIKWTWSFSDQVQAGPDSISKLYEQVTEILTSSNIVAPAPSLSLCLRIYE